MVKFLFAYVQTTMALSSHITHLPSFMLLIIVLMLLHGVKVLIVSCLCLLNLSISLCLSHSLLSTKSFNNYDHEIDECDSTMNQTN